jgi:hypothetical protein
VDSQGNLGDASMKMHESLNKKTETLSEIESSIDTFLVYLSSDKFSNGEDWIRTWEVEKILKEIRSKAQD